MPRLEAPLRDLLRDPADRERQERITRRVMLRRRATAANRARARAPWRAPVAGLAGAVAAALVLLATWWWAAGGRGAALPRGPVLLEGGGAFERLELAVGAPVELTRLSDGSTVELEPGAVLDVLVNDGDAVTVHLVGGAVTLDVSRGTGRRWTVDAGLAQVVVRGTRFRTERSSDRVTVAVSRGVVVVSGELVPGGTRRLEGGQSLELTRADPEPEPPEDAQAAVDGTHAAMPDPHADAEPDAARPPSGAHSWRELARSGAFAEAYERLGSAGVARETRRVATMEELLVLADVARLSGHPRDAVEPLERALALHAADRRAPVAAFTLGRLHLHVLGEPARAARAFERCLALGAPSALREDAHIRLAEARERAGNRTGARTAAAEYLRRFPEGRWTAEARRIGGTDP